MELPSASLLEKLKSKVDDDPCELDEDELEMLLCTGEEYYYARVARIALDRVRVCREQMYKAERALRKVP